MWIAGDRGRVKEIIRVVAIAVLALSESLEAAVHLIELLSPDRVFTFVALMMFRDLVRGSPGRFIV